MKKNAYQQTHEDIAAIIAEAKARKGWHDKDIGQVLGVKANTVCKKRISGIFPEISFFKVGILAEAAGYEIKFEKKEKYH